MAQGLISKKYLIDIANAIRVKLDSQDTYTLAEMATAISTITGGSGTITKSTNTDKGIVTDTLLEGICDALRAKLGTQDTYNPSEIADAILTISGGGSVDIVPWSSGTDEQVAAMIAAAHNNDIDLQTDGSWAVGDVRTITVDSFTTGDNVSVPQQNIDIVISSFADYKNCGCVMQFDFKDCLSETVKMNNTSSNAYKTSKMYTTTLPALVNALPSWLKNSLVEFPIIVGTGQQYHVSETVSNNKLALRALIEVTGNQEITVSGQGSQIPYYANSANRIKKLGHNGTAGSWWSNSSRYTSTNQYYYINETGISSYAQGHNTNNGLAPFGCL